MLTSGRLCASLFALTALATTSYAEDLDTEPCPDGTDPCPNVPTTTSTQPAPSTQVNVDVAPTVDTSPIIEPAPTYVAPVESDDDMLGGLGFAMTLGGGITGFTDDTLRDATDTGGNWDVRATIGTRSVLAFEGSYIGSAQGIDALGLDEDAILVGNGLQAAVRLNVTTGDFQPFLFAGAAWRHYDITNADINTSDIADSDDVLEIPMGVGLAYKYRGFLFDTRGEFRATTSEDLMPDLTRTSDDFASMHRWGVNANIGYEF